MSVLPDDDGIALCRRIRSHLNVHTATIPVLMLTARSRPIDLVVGLDCGADDFLTKPFRLDELHAHIRALLRRSEKAHLHIVYGDLLIDRGSRTASRSGRGLGLTGKEFDLLLLLAQRAGEVLHRDWIFETIWRYPIDSNSNSLDVYIGALRKKLEHGDRSKLIHTVRGVGYVLREAP